MTRRIYDEKEKYLNAFQPTGAAGRQGVENG